MKLNTKFISYLKAQAGEVIRFVAGGRKPMVVTLNGEATAVPQDTASYEQTWETPALLKILAMSTKSYEAGKVRHVPEAFAQIRWRILR